MADLGMQTRPSTFVINLDRRPDRLEGISRHLANRGVDFTRWAAVDGAIADDPVIREDLIGPGHAAAMASHRHLWEVIADGGSEVALILEDDVVLSAHYDWATMVPDLGREMLAADIGLLQLGYLSYGWRPRLAYGVSDWLTARARRLNRPGASEGEQLRIAESVDVVLGDFRMGTHCYLVQRRAARLLTRLNRPALLHCDGMLAQLSRLDPTQVGWRIGRAATSLAGQASEQKGKLADSDTI